MGDDTTPKKQLVQIEPGWYERLEPEFHQPYWQALTTSIKKLKQEGTTVYPPGQLIFNAFNKTPLEKVKVVILGQDPYHNPGEAMGLSFSVPRNKRTPPSLKRIYKEIVSDVGIDMPTHGDLTSWAEQGVFLLNAMLTVEHKKAGSHRKLGWQKFTDAVIRRLSDEKEHLVFMLWGNFARKKAELIDGEKHLILESAHPSPLAGDKFFGNHHFSQANAYLEKHGMTPIDWSVPD